MLSVQVNLSREVTSSLQVCHLCSSCRRAYAWAGVGQRVRGHRTILKRRHVFEAVK